MRLPFVALAAVLLAAGCQGVPPIAPEPEPVTSWESATPATGSGVSTWPTPVAALTPGALTPGCTVPRPASQRDVTSATRAAVLSAYHYTGPTGIANVELDHRIPFFLCGANTAANLWPEPYDGAPTSTYVHNRKDQLEAKVATMVHSGALAVPAAQDLFRGDWRVAWCSLVHEPGVICP